MYETLGLAIHARNLKLDLDKDESKAELERAFMSAVDFSSGSGRC